MNHGGNGQLNDGVRQFKRYPAYKELGLGWLRRIPSHWIVTTIKRIAQKGYRTFVDGDWIELPFITNDGIRLLQTGNIGIGRYKEQGFRYISEETFASLSCTEVLPGDVLICRLAEPVGRACIAPTLERRMITAVDVAILKLAPAFDNRFAVYSLSSSEYLAWMQALCRGGTRDRVSRSQLGAINFIAPSPDEQRQIANFLDRETAKIDALVATKEHLIELLQEKRTALISHAVTKGLDPYVPMKNSGVEWLGGIPKHWYVSRIKWVAKMESRHTPDKKVEAYWENCNIPWVSLNDTRYLKEHEYITETAYSVNELGLANSSARLLPARAVVFSRDATIGRCAITTVPMAVSQHFIAWLCGPNLSPEFLLFVFRSMPQELERLTMGATLKTIGMPDVKQLVTPVPPIDEQQQIVDYIRTETQKLDRLIVKVLEAIDKFSEFRTALISAAVTGKIDVREEVA